MAKRGFRPEDGLRLKTATDPDLSADGRRVAFVVTETDVERDRPRASQCPTLVKTCSVSPSDALR